MDVNVTLRRVCETIAGWKSNKYYMFTGVRVEHREHGHVHMCAR
jgi:hypothetical protein